MVGNIVQIPFASDAAVMVTGMKVMATVFPMMAMMMLAVMAMMSVCQCWRSHQACTQAKRCHCHKHADDFHSDALLFGLTSRNAGWSNCFGQ